MNRFRIQALQSAARTLAYHDALDHLCGRPIKNNPFHPIYQKEECLAYLVEYEETRARHKERMMAQ